jgi:hypothetical protein
MPGNVAEMIRPVGDGVIGDAQSCRVDSDNSAPSLTSTYCTLRDGFSNLASPGISCLVAIMSSLRDLKGKQKPDIYPVAVIVPAGDL